MPTIERSALVPYRAEDMFELVLDVAGYGEFLPWCRSGEVIEQDEWQQRAAIIIAVPGNPRFITLNRLDSPRAIDMALDDGPFRNLTGAWRFTPIGEAGCRVELLVNFEFATPLIARALKPAFLSACESLVQAFSQRAAETLSPLS